MKLFLLYLKEKRKWILLQLICGALLLISFYLYRLPMAAAIYPLFLCFGISLVMMGIDFYQVRKRYVSLKRISKLTAFSEELLPQNKGLWDCVYGEMLGKLWKEHQSVLEAAEKEYEDRMDYYTLWAHQIKTPIAGMRLTLQNEDSALSRKLMGELFRIEQYVEMALAFLRLDSRTTDYRFEECSLDKIVRQAVKKFRGEFIARKLKLSYEPSKDQIVTDEKWLAFVIEQVLSNALKYTPSGEISIFTDGEKKLFLQDTGMGILPEDLPRVFEKGYTGYRGREDHRASGIGLYLCKRICENIGHSIEIKSRPGQGTTVIIDLNRKQTIYE